MPPCAAADEVRGQNLATAELKARTLSTTRVRPKELELSAAAESRTTGWWGTSTRSTRRGNNGDLLHADTSTGDEPASRFFLPVRRYNARVQRPSADALKCALYRSRSACNEMLGACRKGI